MINVKHSATKEPLSLFFVDLEPRNINKKIYQLHFLQRCKSKVETPGHKWVIAQCTRCQAMATQKGDCTMYTVPKLWPHKRLIAQCTRCQSYGHTRE
jgi:hypothetical protein